MKYSLKRITACFLAFAILNTHAQKNSVISVKVNKPVATIEPTMWGIFFEDINMGADGGLYAELVKNRSFEFFKPLMGWTVQQKTFNEGAVLVINRKEENPNNPRFLRVTVNGAATGDLKLTNEGFRGMGIKKDVRYDFSMLYRQTAPGIKMHVGLIDSTGAIIGESVIIPAYSDGAWHKQSGSFHATATVPKAKMTIRFEGTGIIDLDMISLFPSDTWKNRPGGMRRDMVQLLADMKPGFMRFPGGCIVEGYDLSQRYQWKKTVGPVEDRPLTINRWNFEFAHKPTPDYFQTFGLGFFEYFQIAEDIGAEPLPILNCGMACQFNTGEVVPLSELGPYVQDALDLIEFANGSETSQWGKVRAAMGHPAPFNLKLLGIGNENWGPQYLERLAIFTKAIKEKYPDIKLVSSSGTDPNGERFEFLNTRLRKENADIIDEHYYRNPQWFLENAKRYDSYPRKGAKVFAGEYAAQSDRVVSIHNRNNWLTALSEAAFMTGLERNAEVVTLASYAPLFAHADGWQWTPDLIWVNNLESFGTPDYYVQQLFSLNKGTQVVPISLKNDVIAGQDSLYASAALDSKTNELIIKLVNVSSKAQSHTIAFEGIKPLNVEGQLIVMQNDDLNAMNSFAQPLNVAPKQSGIRVKGKSFALNVAARSFTILRVKLN